MRFGRCSWFFVAALAFAGCRTTRPVDSIPDPTFEDDFGSTSDAPITEESVAREEMLFERAQFELRFGGQFPFDILRPSEDSNIDPGLGVGAKFAYEVEKNVFLGFLVDWTFHDVQDPGEVAGANQIDQIEDFQKWNFLLTFDYDVPLTESRNPLILRLGAAAGVNLEKFNERDASLNTFDTFVSFIFRPSIGLRFPIAEHLLLFGELSYDLIPERDLETNESAEVSGIAPVFSDGGIWVGLAYEWY